MQQDEQKDPLTLANARIERLTERANKYRKAYLEAYRAVCKHLNQNGMHPAHPQFLQEMFMDLEMWEYEDDDSGEGFYDCCALCGWETRNPDESHACTLGCDSDDTGV